MPGADIATPADRYKLHLVFINIKTGVAYDEQDPIDQSRVGIVTNLTVFLINNRQKEYGKVLFPDTKRVISWAKKINNQRSRIEPRRGLL